ncbi:Pyruvate/Phosphoenolpyruvate kinase-like domain-containing protein [Coprinopsis sp. MPI-PUGE-AT-0042]|nr:Pyruvate/Phosphoenolpyruvate kinase-like domain-containing protein [Coprinopsis sp. MPI-PUGE-AT-0042]
MSVRPQAPDAAAQPPRRKVTIQTLHSLRQSKTPISMPKSASVTPSTTRSQWTKWFHHARAVSRGTTHPFLVADMPFGSYHISVEDAIRNAVRLMEGGKEIAPIVRRFTEVGIPVMAHIGLLPQRHALSGYKVQGRSVKGARKVVEDALALQEAGACSMVVEAYVTEKVRVPTIGIGAGPDTSGQVLVLDDIMGTWSGHKAKFVRDSGIHKYSEAVRDGSFPDPEKESYTMDPQLWQQFLEEENKS